MLNLKSFLISCTLVLSANLATADASGFENGCNDSDVGYRWVSNYRTFMRADVVELITEQSKGQSILLHCASNKALIVSGNPRGLRAFEKMALARRHFSLVQAAKTMRKEGAQVRLEDRSRASCLCSTGVMASAFDVFAAVKPLSQKDHD